MRDLGAIARYLNGTDSKYQPRSNTKPTPLQEGAKIVNDLISKHILGTPSFITNLQNANNMAYIGPVYVGSNLQKFNLIFDAGSD
jgi:predicted nucleic-acid-binding Zn-ribbon protein